MNDVFKNIEDDLRLQKADSVAAPPGELDSKWQHLTTTQPQAYINPDLTINREALKNFRRNAVFIFDMPHRSRKYALLETFNLLYFFGSKRAQRKLLREQYHLISKEGNLDLLKKYPIPDIGRPNVFNYKGCRYTFRWMRHILFTGQFNKFIAPRLKADFTLLDLGSSYGIFPSLIKQEHPQSHQVLVDFPEQLILAHYYLQTQFPDAKIATYKDIHKLKSISKAFLKKYDFVLIPWFLYKKLASKSIDVFSNFASLQEMRREWFDYYLKSQPFLSAKFFFTANRFQSAPEYDTDLTILDYELHKYKPIQFRVSPYFTHFYFPKFLFFIYKFHISSQYFDFIGERKS